MVKTIFTAHNIPFVIDQNIIPEDNTTLFISAGMQRVKDRFIVSDKTKHGSLQSCIRTNDLELVGDTSHLTYFEMLGNFSFGRNDYLESIILWDEIVKKLDIPITHVAVHPDAEEHYKHWINLKYKVILDKECIWKDGTLTGRCCEMFVDNLEIGNLVNMEKTSTDVGFGFERLVQIKENKKFVNQTSLFDVNLHPIVRDHKRTLNILFKNNVFPGGKGRNYITRILLRRLSLYLDGSENFIFNDWLKLEKEIQQKTFKEAKRALRKNKDKPFEWWYDTFGLTLEEYKFLIGPVS